MELEIKCDKCNADISSSTISSCWKDKHLPDHVGLCCSCFDVSLGKRPPTVLGLRTVAAIDSDDDDLNPFDPEN